MAAPASPPRDNDARSPDLYRATCVHGACRRISDRARRAVDVGWRDAELFSRYSIRPDAAMGRAGVAALSRHHIPLVCDRTRDAWRDIGGRHSSGLRAASARRPPLADDWRNYYPAARHPWPRNRFGTAPDLWRLQRFPPLLVVHSRRPRRLHPALHGALGKGGVRGD